MASAWGTLLAALAVALGLATAHDRALLGGRRAPRALLLRGDAASSLETRDGRQLGIGSDLRRANRLWAMVEVRDPWRRRLLVAADMLGAEDFRRLRLWALWGRLPAGAWPIRRG